MGSRMDTRSTGNANMHVVQVRGDYEEMLGSRERQMGAKRAGMSGGEICWGWM